MKLSRVVVRLPDPDREELDRLRKEYAQETREEVPRAAVIRMLLRRALTGTRGRKAIDVLQAPEVAASSFRTTRRPGGAP